MKHSRGVSGAAKTGKSSSTNRVHEWNTRGAFQEQPGRAQVQVQTRVLEILTVFLRVRDFDSLPQRNGPTFSKPRRFIYPLEMWRFLGEPITTFSQIRSNLRGGGGVGRLFGAKVVSRVRLVETTLGTPYAWLLPAGERCARSNAQVR